MRAVTNTLHPSAIQYWISVTSPLASDKVSGYKCKKGPKTKIIFLTTGVPVVGRLACYYFLSFILFFADECLVFLLFVSLVFIYCCIACKARKSFLKMEFVIVVDRVIERNRGDSKKKECLVRLFLALAHFPPPLSRLSWNICLLLLTLSFVGALRSCSNVMSCQACSSFLSFF